MASWKSPTVGLGMKLMKRLEMLDGFRVQPDLQRAAQVVVPVERVRPRRSQELGAEAVLQFPVAGGFDELAVVLHPSHADRILGKRNDRAATGHG